MVDIRIHFVRLFLLFEFTGIATCLEAKRKIPDFVHPGADFKRRSDRPVYVFRGNLMGRGFAGFCIVHAKKYIINIKISAVADPGAST